MSRVLMRLIVNNGPEDRSRSLLRQPPHGMACAVGRLINPVAFPGLRGFVLVSEAAAVKDIVFGPPDRTGCNVNLVERT